MAETLTILQGRRISRGVNEVVHPHVYETPDHHLDQLKGRDDHLKRNREMRLKAAEYRHVITGLRPWLPKNLIGTVKQGESIFKRSNRQAI